MARAVGNAGIVDEHVQLAVALLYGHRGSVDAGLVSHIQPYASRPAGPGRRDDGVAEGGELGGDLAANAPACSSDECDHVSSLPLPTGPALTPIRS
ncbi:hypothetical protein GCM10009765_54890 [Fodinicola feengrottensis]|uniref:Uncharacterized protein n=1 Tax=Fodinicola feengrottensis TaxID=435914 RepID=A0ABP4U3E1_9ACTN